MKIQSKYCFTRNEIGQAISMGMIDLLIGNVIRHVNTDTKEYSLALIICVMTGKPMQFPDGSVSNVYLRCERFDSTGESKITRVPIICVSNKEPCLTDNGFEFVRAIPISDGWLNMMFTNRMVISWMNEIESFEYVDETPESPRSTYSGE